MAKNRKGNKIIYIKNVVDNKLSTTFSKLQSLSFIPTPKNLIDTIYTVHTRASIKSVVDNICLCNKCFSQLEKLWIVCPYCGEKIVN
jgi:hypothetical protein